MSAPRFIVVTPAFNEEQYLDRTIFSMALQTLKPVVWVVVDDGSEDGTERLLEQACGKVPFLVVTRRDRQVPRGGDGLLAASEAAAFNFGLRAALKACPRPDYLVKLDADLEFGRDYFAALVSAFEGNPRLGIAGGTIKEWHGGTLVRDATELQHVRGATKMYRRECFEHVGGVRNVFGWDVIDETLARHLGWETRSLLNVDLVHLRRTASRGGRLKGWARNGHLAYYIGYDPLYFSLRVLYRLLFRRDLLQGVGLAAGYLSRWASQAGQLPDVEIRAMVRNEQRARLRQLVKVG